jgi:hypothetical protein
MSKNINVIDTKGCEFGYEIIMVLPYVYYLHKQNVPLKVLTSRGMKSFYFFLKEDEYEEKYQKRTWVEPHLLNVPLKTIHFPQLNKTQWEMPNFKEHYQNFKLNTTFEKEILLINNKYNFEWGHPPINFLSVEVLDILFEGLSPYYTIIYNRPNFQNIPEDFASTWGNIELEDFSLIKEKYPNVIDSNELIKQETYDFNTLQLILGSNSTKQISVQGGNSILASLTGGTNLVYAIKGHEITHNSFNNWYPEFSGALVKSTNNYSELINWVQNYYINSLI